MQVPFPKQDQGLYIQQPVYMEGGCSSCIDYCLFSIRFHCGESKILCGPRIVSESAWILFLNLLKKSVYLLILSAEFIQIYPPLSKFSENSAKNVKRNFKF